MVKFLPHLSIYSKKVGLCFALLGGARVVVCLAGADLHPSALGLRGDGRTDDAPALARVLAAGRGRTIHLPAGRYRIGHTVLVPAGTKLVGAEAGAQETGAQGDVPAGAPESILVAANPGQPVLALAGGGSITVAHLVFSGGGMTIGGPGEAVSQIELRGNAFRDIPANAIEVAGVLRASLIDSNRFERIAPPGYEHATYASLGCPKGCEGKENGINIYGGLDRSRITNNSFDVISRDAIHLGWNDALTASRAFIARDVTLAYNRFTRVHSMAIEIQAVWDWDAICKQHPENCRNPVFLERLTVKGNYQRQALLPYWGTYGYSLVPGKGAREVEYLNNTAINTARDGCYGHLGYGIEDSGGTVLTQGNVIASERAGDCKEQGWQGPAVVLGEATDAASRYRLVNNILCGPETPHGPGWEGLGAGGAAGTLAEVGNLKRESCAEAGNPLGGSRVQVELASDAAARAAAIPGPGHTAEVAVRSALAVKFVKFYVDDGSEAVAAEERQEPNPDFARDRRWLYRTAFDTSGLKPGRHKLRAVATDVAGASASAEGEFTVGAANTSS